MSVDIVLNLIVREDINVNILGFFVCWCVYMCLYVCVCVCVCVCLYTSIGKMKIMIICRFSHFRIYNFSSVGPTTMTTFCITRNLFLGCLIGLGL